jgi:hypothetical protein
MSNIHSVHSLIDNSFENEVINQIKQKYRDREKQKLSIYNEPCYSTSVVDREGTDDDEEECDCGGDGGDAGALRVTVN